MYGILLRQTDLGNWNRAGPIKRAPNSWPQKVGSVSTVSETEIETSIKDEPQGNDASQYTRTKAAAAVPNVRHKILFTNLFSDAHKFVCGALLSLLFVCHAGQRLKISIFTLASALSPPACCWLAKSFCRVHLRSLFDLAHKAKMAYSFFISWLNYMDATGSQRASLFLFCWHASTINENFPADQPSAGRHI